MPDVEVRFISAAETRPLRQAILRPGRPPETLIYPEDEDEEAAHFGAYVRGELVGVASVYRRTLPGADDLNAWQLRGMATLESVRGRGYGKTILKRCVEHVAQRHGSILWCNARKGAVGFYEASGFEIVGEEFDVPDIGAHFVMRRRVG